MPVASNWTEQLFSKLSKFTTERSETNRSLHNHESGAAPNTPPNQAASHSTGALDSNARPHFKGIGSIFSKAFQFGKNDNKDDNKENESIHATSSLGTIHTNHPKIIKKPNMRHQRYLYYFFFLFLFFVCHTCLCVCPLASYFNMFVCV